MKFSATIISLAAAASAASIDRRAYGDYPGVTATVTPFLAPLCEITDAVTQPVCKFTPISVSGKCVDVTQACVVHPPTSFKAQLDTDGYPGCRVAVFPNFGCKGDEVTTGVLSTAPSTCNEAPYFNKVLTGGLLSSASLLPFGFKSAKLICN